MSNQIGFDFGGDHVPAYSEQPEGTWLDQGNTTSGFTAIFARVDEIVNHLPVAARPLFLAGVGSAREVHSDMIEHGGEHLAGTYELWRTTFEATDDEVNAFFAMCESRSGTRVNGLEYKVRSGDGMSGDTTIAGIFVEGAGSVVISKWGNGNAGMEYVPYRDTFFLQSYLDDRRRIFEPCTTWVKAYCAQKFTEAGDGVPSVPTFTVNGREYISTGSMSHGSYWACNAWTFVPESEWTGPTFTYNKLIKAFDRGTVERGDKRGSLIRVRGQLCVIDGAALIYDDKAAGRTIQADEEDDPNDEEFDLNEQEAEAEC